MLNLLTQDLFHFPNLSMPRLAHLLGLAASHMMVSIFGYTLASSLFLSKAGAEKLPIAYILIGLLSIPLYTAFSQVVDRISRPQLFQGLLVGEIIFTLAVRLLLLSGSLPVYYLIFIVYYFQWILLTDIMFPSLVSDYFTSLDWKRYATHLGIAAAVGGILGGGLIGICSAFLTTENMLLILPVLAIMLIGQINYLDHHEKPLATGLQESHSSSGQGFQEFFKLGKHYQIIFFLAGNVFLFVILFTLAEFQYFTIYSRAFPNEQQLTQFLGGLRILSNVLELLFLYFVTRPLIQKLGVSRMNLVYAGTTLAGFIGLALNFGLPSAIALNLNNESFERSLNKPVQALNYNAVPHSFVGQARSLCEGFFYSLGLACAGGLLWLSHTILTPFQITFIGITSSLIFVGVRYLQGKSYLQSLLTVLGFGSVDFEQVGEGLTRVPAKSSGQICQLLRQESRHAKVSGLELASRLDDPTPVLSAIDPLLLTSDPVIHHSIVKFLSRSQNPNVIRYIAILLTSDREQYQLIALESIIASQQILTDAELRHLLRKTALRGVRNLTKLKNPLLMTDATRSRLRLNSIVKALTCVAAWEAASADTEVLATCEWMWQSELENGTREAIIRGIRNSGKPQLVPLLPSIMRGASAEVKREGLETLTQFTSVGNTQTASLAVTELSHSNAFVRAAAYKLLGVVQISHILPQIAEGLKDNSIAVRTSVAAALAHHGEKSLPISQSYLNSPRPEVVEMAITAIAKVATRSAETLLFQYLEPDYALVAQTQRWLVQIPTQDRNWHFFRIAVRDYHQRLIERVFYVISNLDHKAIMKTVRQNLRHADARVRANTIEMLASSRYRRFILPILPLLEEEEMGTSHSLGMRGVDLKKILHEASFASDRWLRIGALQTCFDQNRSIPKPLLTDSDPVVQSVAKSLDKSNDLLIDQILFLKSTSFLKSLCLEDLLQIHGVLKQQEFSAGEIIYSPQQDGIGLYFLYQGTVWLSGDGDPSPGKTLTQGDSFGNMALLENTPFAGTTTAKTDCTVLILPKEEFDPLIELYPRLLLCFGLQQ